MIAGHQNSIDKGVDVLDGGGGGIASGNLQSHCSVDLQLNGLVAGASEPTSAQSEGLPRTYRSFVTLRQ